MTPPRPPWRAPLLPSQPLDGSCSLSQGEGCAAAPLPVLSALSASQALHQELCQAAGWPCTWQATGRELVELCLSRTGSKLDPPLAAGEQRALGFGGISACVPRQQDQWENEGQTEQKCQMPPQRLPSSRHTGLVFPARSRESSPAPHSAPVLRAPLPCLSWLSFPAVWPQTRDPGSA